MTIQFPILLNNWQGDTAATVFTAFDGQQWAAYREPDAIPVEEKPEFKGAEILLASYGTPSYEGYAFVLFRRGGKLYEVNGSHCSCYGLEGQWEPEETTVEALRHRVAQGNLGAGKWDENPFAAELLQVLEALDSESKTKDNAALRTLSRLSDEMGEKL